MGFWGPNGHDGIWHISLASSLARFSGEMPVFSGEVLKNYHLGFDASLALLHLITRLPFSLLYFQILPPLLAAAVGFAVYRFVTVWTGSKSAARWVLFFTYFGGSFGWLVSLVRFDRLGGESMFWSAQSISTLINPPFAVSLIFLFSGLTYFILDRAHPRRLYFWIQILLFGLVGFYKVYAGVIVMSGLGLCSLQDWIQGRRSRTLQIFAGSLVLFLLAFLPANSGSSGLLVWQPLWFLETMMGLSDRLDWWRFYQAMTNYRLGGNWIKAVPAYAVALAIFLAGNFGTRLLGFWHLKSHDRSISLSLTGIFLLQGIAIGIIFPMFFLQKGTPWNTIQFFYYSQIFAGILAGIAVDSFLQKQKKSNSILIITILAILTLPTTFDTLRHYLPSRPPAKISNEEIEALRFLSVIPDGVVLVPPFNRSRAQYGRLEPPRPLYAYESSAYVSAYSDHPVYMEDEVNLDITGYDWHTRKSELEAFFNTKNIDEARQFLNVNYIRYIYLSEVAFLRPRFSATQLGFEGIFENGQAAIWARTN